MTFISPCLWDVKDAVDTSKGSSSLSSYPSQHFTMACLMLHISVLLTKWQWKLLHSSGKGNGAEWKPQQTGLPFLSSLSLLTKTSECRRQQNRRVWALKTRFRNACHKKLRPKIKLSGAKQENNPRSLSAGAVASAFAVRNQLIHTKVWLQGNTRGSTNPPHSYLCHCTFLKCITLPEKSRGRRKHPVLLHTHQGHCKSL